MNKKVFILPLAVAAMGLASCNKGAKELSKSEAVKYVLEHYEAAETKSVKQGGTFKFSISYSKDALTALGGLNAKTMSQYMLASLIDLDDKDTQYTKMMSDLDSKITIDSKDENKASVDATFEYDTSKDDKNFSSLSSKVTKDTAAGKWTELEDTYFYEFYEDTNSIAKTYVENNKITIKGTYFKYISKMNLALKITDCTLSYNEKGFRTGTAFKFTESSKCEYATGLRSELSEFKTLATGSGDLSAVYSF